MTRLSNWIPVFTGMTWKVDSGHYSTVLTRVWVDQDLKREMGF